MNKFRQSINEIIILFLGDKYISGVATLTLMFLYPIHQSLGQINGSLLYATEKTKVHVNIGIFFMSFSILTVYFMLAPSNLILPGLNLGSDGLAIKMVIMQLIQVNITGYVISRIFGWKFDWVYQIFIIITVIFLGWTSKFLITSFFSIGIISMFSLSFFIYIIMILSSIYFMPWLLSLTKTELRNGLSHLIFRIR